MSFYYQLLINKKMCKLSLESLFMETTETGQIVRWSFEWYKGSGLIFQMVNAKQYSWETENNTLKTFMIQVREWRVNDRCPEKQERKEFNIAVKSSIAKYFLYTKQIENVGPVYTVCKIMLGACW